MSQINHKTCSCSSTDIKRSITRTLLHHIVLERRQLVLLFVCANLLQHVVMAQGAVGAGVNDARFVYNKSKANVNSDADTNVKLLEENETDPIPMDFYRQLNNITDISEFVEKFIDPDSIDPKLGIPENLRRSVERASVVRAKSANCIPEPTVVDLTPINPKSNYFPRCTRVKRCGGCCSTPWMSCQPTKTEIVNYQVYRYCYEHGAKFCGLDVIPVEQHLECKCDCRIKPKDCNPYQVYEDCRCHCTNTDARDKCLELEHKDWDDESCRCVCRQTENCTTGSYYDENQCKCLLLPNNAQNEGDVAVPPPSVLADRRRYIVKAIPVENDNGTMYHV
ncbi:PDGF- and VEGF-related factor 1 isoform X1 [Haematobia irritans]|uniref:Putative platelet-derived growth factor pdgf n=1 Tax=Haematobia irritans TaxID=7368 RepID=A0A1L8EIV1_HAEIR